MMSDAKDPRQWAGGPSLCVMNVLTSRDILWEPVVPRMAPRATLSFFHGNREPVLALYFAISVTERFGD